MLIVLQLYSKVLQNGYIRRTLVVLLGTYVVHIWYMCSTAVVLFAMGIVSIHVNTFRIILYKCMFYLFFKLCFIVCIVISLFIVRLLLYSCSILKTVVPIAKSTTSVLYMYHICTQLYPIILQEYDECTRFVVLSSIIVIQ